MTRVAVLHGGMSAEREVSLRTGQQVVEALIAAGFEVTAHRSHRRSRRVDRSA